MKSPSSLFAFWYSKNESELIELVVTTKVCVPFTIHSPRFPLIISWRYVPFANVFSALSLLWDKFSMNPKHTNYQLYFKFHVWHWSSDVPLSHRVRANVADIRGLPIHKRANIGLPVVRDRWKMRANWLLVLKTSVMNDTICSRASHAAPALTSWALVASISIGDNQFNMQGIQGLRITLRCRKIDL